MLDGVASKPDSLIVAHAVAVRPTWRAAVVALALLMIVLASWYGVQVVLLEHTASAALNATPGDATAPLALETPLQVSVHGAGVELVEARLLRTENDLPGAAEQPVDIDLQDTDAPATWQVVPRDRTTALLQPDGDYRLIVRAVAPRPALPLPRTEVFERQYRFTTVASPHASVPAQVQMKHWLEPLSLTWSQPMRSFAATTVPPAPLRTWIDADDQRRVWLQFDDAGLPGGVTYLVQVTAARNSDGLSARRPVSFQVATPERPRFVDVPTDPVTLTYGQQFMLRSAAPLAGAHVSAAGDLPLDVSVDQDAIRVGVGDFRQGAEVDLTVDSATSLEGAPLQAPVRVRLTTPPALGAPTLSPPGGQRGVKPATRPSIVFPEAIADEAAATRALYVEPEVPGHWQWLSPREVQFVPDGRLPHLSEVTIGVRGGPDGPRGASGGFLEQDASTTFRTTDFKRMEVSLSRQTMTLYEDDVPVRTIYVATGVAGAPTPTGTFQVQYKQATARFRGTNPDGSQYDIPDVHWVMPFFGDYTIHGAYWR
ncbi:MAG: L,D-transpeptidase, partial [Chloroflexota bacterium]|nr:L,D-transpeptidase [Chloroflexota bacterium]